MLFAGSLVAAGAARGADEARPATPGAATADGQDWPCWGGPNGNLQVDTPIKLLDRWPEGGPKVVWKVNYGELMPLAGNEKGGGYGSSSPVVAKGKVYAYSMRQRTLTESDQPDKSWQTDHVFCFDAKTGAKLWQADLGMGMYYPVCQTTHGGGGLNSPTPCVADGRLFINGSGSQTYCLDADTGKVLWQVKNGLPSNYLVFVSFVVADGKAITFDHDPSSKPPGPPTGDCEYDLCRLTAYDVNSGKKLWKTAFSQGAWNNLGEKTPIVWRPDGPTGKTYILANRRCVDASDGRLLWDYGGGRCSQGCAVDGGILVTRTYPHTGNGARAYAITKDGCAQSPLWLVPTGGERGGSPIICKGYVYLLSGYESFCVEAATGKVVWKLERKEVRNSPSWGECSSPIRVNDKFIKSVADVHGSRGKYTGCITMVQASPAGWEFRRAFQPCGGFSTPAFAAGRLYVQASNMGTLSCYDLTEAGNQGAPALVTTKPAPSAKEAPGAIVPSPNVTGSAEGLLAAGSAGQWPAFRGPGTLAAVEDKNTAVTWNTKTGEGIRWKAEVPLGGSSSPILWGERVFLTGAVEGQAAVFCFDAKSGKLLWRRDVRLTGKVQFMSKDTGYAAPTPATDGKRVFAVFATGDAAAFGLDGTPAWTMSLGVPDIPYGYASSPALFKELLLIQYDQESKEGGKAVLVALDTQSGQAVWRAKRSFGPSWSSPLVIGTRGGPQIVATACNGVAAYNPADGSEIWAVLYESRDLAPSAGLAKGRVIVPIAGGGTLAVSPDGRGDVTKTHVAWLNEDACSEVPCPVGYGDWVFLVSYGKLMCLRAGDGKEVGSRDLDAQFWASPVVAGGKLYLVSREGKATILKAGPACEVVGEATLGEPVCATPAVAGGCLFVRTAKTLYCIGRPAL